MITTFQKFQVFLYLVQTQYFAFKEIENFLYHEPKSILLYSRNPETKKFESLLRQLEYYTALLFAEVIFHCFSSDVS